MLFNRIINDIIDWVRRLLYWRKKAITSKPYTVREVYNWKYGVLKLVDRDTPRAVWTYVFSPQMHPSTNVVGEVFDYHICLDHLYAVKKDKLLLPVIPALVSPLTITEKVANKPVYSTDTNKYTHAVTILQASKWLDAEGSYKTSILYHKQFNFIGDDMTHYRDKYALPVFREAVGLLKTYPFDEIDWTKTIEKSQKKFMGSYYIKEPSSPDMP